MAAYHRDYDSRHLQADYKEPHCKELTAKISFGTLRSVIEYRLSLLLPISSHGFGLIS